MGKRSIGFEATLAALVLLSVLSMSVALAEGESDPPDRVARLSYVNGTVSLQPAGVEDWTDATVNRPLTTGDKLWADQSSRAELDMGSAAIRLGSTTGVSFLNLDDQTAQLNVTAGTAIVHVRDLAENQTFEIDTPNVAILLRSPGDYRVEVNDAGDSTVVKVSNGEAEVSATGQTVPLHTQQAFVFSGTNQVTADATSVGAPDALDSWSLDRDRRAEEAREQASEYVPPDVAGVDDLGEYGRWQDTPDYGPVWTPTVVAGWSPYHYGRWVWVAPWGWTWVDDAPWGFVPFHYGRWAYYGTQWCWVPGPRYVRPVYAPALVAWVGSPGASVSIAVGGGPAVGWFPLGPREVYVPGYRVSPTYVRNVNVTNTTIVNNTYITNVYENKVTNINYVNRNRPGAVVAVSQDVFTSARPISGQTMRIPDNQLARFSAQAAPPAIVPARESVLGHRPDANVRRPPAAFINRPVVARTAPPPAPAPFERQVAAIRANGGRPLGREQIAALQPQAATNPRVRVVAPGPVRPIQNSNQQFGAGRPGQAGRFDRPAQGGGQQFGTARPEQPARAEPSLQERERALHATPIPPQENRPPENRPSESRSFGEPAQSFRTDRPPQSQMRNDQYRLQNNEESRRQAEQARPTPQAVPQARPIEQQREFEQSRSSPQARPIEQPRAVEQPRPVPRATPFEQPRPEFRPPEPPRPIERPVERPVEQPRQEAPRAVEQPRAVPQPQQRPAAPPPARPEDRRPNQERRDPRVNRP